MKSIMHKTAEPSHYDKEALSYDAMNEKNSMLINKTISKLLKEHKVHSVLDLTCGTGSQALYLHNNGYEVAAYDINAKMLKIARQKAKSQNQNIVFKKGDMRVTQAGQFDAAITIFNSIGHLTKSDFFKAVMNINSNLAEGGIYLFDIFNLNFLLHKENITKLTIDWQKQIGNKTYREIQYSTIDEEGILASFDIYLEKALGKEAKVTNASQTLQVYSAKELKELLKKGGFKVVKILNPDGSKFLDKKSERMLVMAQKK